MRFWNPWRCRSCFGGVCALVLLAGASPAAAPARPNILILLADDLGYSDLGCYGGEIETPHLDRLAAQGLRFTQFYNTARCWPSRAALLTGYYAQQVRRDELPGVPSGGRGVRPAWARLLPERLKPLGYRSYHSGKWHVDGPVLRGGFDRSYLLQDQDRHFSPRGHAEDDQPLPPVAPDSGFYGTVAIVDHALKCLRAHARDHAERPFLHYVAFTAPHFPLQALPEDIDRYRDRFRAGWDVLRQQRWERMRKIGLVNCPLSPRTAGVPAWSELSADEQSQWSIRMAIHAAMVDRIDREIGRLLAQLQEMRAADNTAIFFLSDNGASAEKILRGDGHDPEAPPGSARSYLCLEPGWANLANAPLRYSKIYVHEGGIATPFIVHWPRGVAARGELRHTPGHVIDLVPTILDLVGGSWPSPEHELPVPPPGRSLVPAFARDGAVSRDYLWWSHSGNRAIRVGDWKLVSAGGPNSPGWELYDLRTDRSESTNLAAQHPEKVRELSTAWQERENEFRELALRDAPAEPPTPNVKPKGKKKAAP